MSPIVLPRIANKITSVLLILAILALYFVVPTPSAQAAAITSASDTMSNLTVSATSTHAIKFTSPTGAATSTALIVITFPSDFNFTGKTIGTVSLTHGTTTGLEVTETLAASPSASAWGAVFSGTQSRILTLTPPTDGVGTFTLAPNDKVLISYTGASSTNPTTPGSYVITVGGAFGDAGDITVNILTSNQVNISATVPQSLTFSISTTTISFGTLSAVAARYASSTGAGNSTEVEAHNVIVGTNAANGYTMTVGGTTLTYATSTITAIGAANTGSVTGTEQFGLRMTATGGIGSVSAPYAAAGFAFDTGAFPDAIATATGSSANTTYSARYIANITADTEAGSYTGAVTYVASANF